MVQQQGIDIFTKSLIDSRAIHFFHLIERRAGSFFPSNVAFPPALPFSKYCTVPYCELV
jgi:hypothetical protein